MPRYKRWRVPNKCPVHVYAYNGGGYPLLIKAHTLKDAAAGMGVSASHFRKWGGLTNKPASIETDYDFTTGGSRE